jgi:uncharacterized membrane protein
VAKNTRRRLAAEERAAEIQIEQSIVLRERCRREERALEPRRAIGGHTASRAPRSVIADGRVHPCAGQRQSDRASDANGAVRDERARPLSAEPLARGAILEEPMSNGVRNWLKVRFIAGFFVTVPAFLTAWLLWIFWSRIDDVFAPMYQRILGRDLPGLGFLTAIGIIFMMGTIARNVVGRRVLAWGDKLLLRVPIYRRLYPSVKMLIDSFSPERRSAFGAVVLVEHPRQGEYAFGFVTSHVVVEIQHGKREMVTVFIPTNNLYLGDVVLVPRDDVVPTGLPVEEGVRIILSAGNATPRQLPRS